MLSDRCWLAGTAAALALATLAGVAAAEPLDRVLAVLDGRPLMLSEVRLIQELRRLERELALEAAIEERLMFEQAVRLPQIAATEEELEAAFRSLSTLLPDAGDDEGLRAIALRQATILKYVDFRFRPLVRVDTADVRTAYRSDFGETGDAPALATVEEQIRQRLAAEDLDARLEEWVLELRDAAEIRYTDPPRE